MNSDAWSDEVQFEIPTLAAACRLGELLATDWVAGVYMRRNTPSVYVILDQTKPGLGALLRAVEGWVERESLCAIRYEIDGRGYVLEAGEPVWSELPTAHADTGIARHG